jgi:pyruvate dehydrogenase E2 component (dihydrolipoamide acetyltransferase)
MGEFRMPSLGADMTEGTLLEWLVKPGQQVHRGDVVAVVDTAKSAVEVEVFEDGVVDSLLVEPGTTVSVGTPMAVLAGAGAAAPAAPPVAPPAPAAVPEAPHVPSPLPRHRAAQAQAALHVAARPVAAVPSESGRVAASPRARRRAAELGVDLASVRGTGPGGAVTVEDLERTASAPAEAPASAPSEAPAAATTAADRAAAMRRSIGALMARSKREIPHYYLSTTVDLARATAWLQQENARRDVKHRLVPAALLLKAAARACKAVPEVNGWWVEDHFEPSPQVHLGVAVALRPSGLVAPALLDADTLDLDTLMARLTDLVTRARAGTLRASEMSSPTLTVTNLGDQGVEAVHGVIYPPQVALVGFGRVAERPWAVDGLLGVRTVVTATLAADHRVSDGHRGGRYLSAVSDLLQRPEEL